MTRCLFASDLHGRRDRYEKLFAAALRERPAALLLGGDLLPGGMGLLDSAGPGKPDFLNGVLAAGCGLLREAGIRVLAILGNDDPRCEEAGVLDLAARGLLEYVHGRRVELGAFTVYGYSCVPPSPFLLKDWERYDVSRYVDPGCVSPEEGRLTLPRPPGELRFTTIGSDLAGLVGDDDLGSAVLLLHGPPHASRLDRAALDGRQVDHVPLDVHVGSIAARRLIEARQPLLVLCGHVHESARLTGAWREQLGRTWCLSAAHDGPELALCRIDLEDPGAATRELL